MKTGSALIVAVELFAPEGTADPPTAAPREDREAEVGWERAKPIAAGDFGEDAGAFFGG
jgi:hypothetical protein